MLDADFRVRDGWRLRITAQRMARECAQRSVVDCGKGLTVRVGASRIPGPCQLPRVIMSAAMPRRNIVDLTGVATPPICHADSVAMSTYYRRQY